MPPRRLVAAGLGLTAALVMTVDAPGSAPTRNSAPQTATTIATASTTTVRVSVSAERRADPSGAPTAAVTLTISKHARGKWQRTASHRLKSTYFWYSVTGPLSVCQLEIRETAVREGFRPQVTVRLLRSPSLGCGPTHRYPIT